MSEPSNRVTKEYLEGLLLDLEDQINEFPTDEVLRQDGIAESVIAILNEIGERIEHAIAVLHYGEDAHV